MSNIDMAEFGLLNQFAAYAKEYEGEYATGRILLQEKGIYRLISENGELTAEISGKLRYNAKSASDFPAVGDFVLTNYNNMQGHATIHRVLPRKSAFIRKAAGTGCAEQVVAANIDTVFICMSLNNDFNVRRLERYLSVAWSSGAIPVIVLTKADLCSDIKSYVSSASAAALESDVVVTSGLDEDCPKKLLPYIQKGKTVAMIGSSGVGKSTLINRLLGENRLRTNGLRNDGKGKHTTTRRELFLLTHGGMVIDTPGMRELGLWDLDKGFFKSFADIEALAKKCKYRNCSHTNEPYCAVRKAVFNGELSEKRWLSYKKLKNEKSYADNPSDYLAKKNQRFKSIAMMNKSSRKEFKENFKNEIY